MNDQQIIEYLRSRGQARPPVELVPSVMAAVDAAPAPRSRFAAYLPAAAVAGVVAIVAAVAILLGQGPNVGPGPSPSAEASARPASVEELEEAVLGAVDVLRESPGVEGIGSFSVRGELASASWFSWRPNGDQVIVNRTDVDVTQTAWWLDPQGEPPAVGENMETTIQVLVDDAYYRTGGPNAGADEWTREDRSTAPDVLGLPFPAVLDGEIDPLRFVGEAGASEGVASVRDRSDGAAVWTLTRPYRTGSAVAEYRIGPDGALRSWASELVDVEPTLEDASFVTASSIELTPLTDAGPIEAPDVDAAPDPSDFGLPADFPLAAREGASEIDYRAYVEDALDVLQAHHWNSADINWDAARSTALDGLPEDLEATQAHQRIFNAIATFDPFNTHFVRPPDVPPGDAGGDDGSGELPSADRIGDVGHVVLPAPGDGGVDAFREYLRAARSAMAAVEAAELACGWIVDLRDYDGGAWGPTMMVLGGLLGEGRALSFTSPAGEWALEVAADGVVRVDSDELGPAVRSPYIDTSREADSDDEFVEIVDEEPPHVPSVTDPPVAVLVGNGTLSGGEQTLVAFLGRPETRIFGGMTGGRPIVAPNYQMTDGAVLRIPTWVPVDRDGTRYTTNIAPDEIVGDTRAVGSDAILDAAVGWLDGQPGCA